MKAKRPLNQEQKAALQSAFFGHPPNKAAMHNAQILGGTVTKQGISKALAGAHAHGSQSNYFSPSSLSSHAKTVSPTSRGPALSGAWSRRGFSGLTVTAPRPRSVMPTSVPKPSFFRMAA